ncbi:MAG: hypothetical protein JOY54_09065 [Acidobacteriaceae bacterium]|nr:hypothetical protein [Acidobacteriaceae bacterium]
MNLDSLLELARVLLAFALVFVAAPLLAEGQGIVAGWGSSTSETVQRLVRAFVRASFAAEILCLVLGKLRLCRPGLLVSLCIVWAVAGGLNAYRLRSISRGDAARGLWRPLVALLEDERPTQGEAPSPGAFARINISWRSKLLLTAGLAVLVLNATNALSQVHYHYSDTYTRAVSLSALTSGQRWTPDASVALLAPLVSFSGLNSAAVIRFTGPIWATLFALLFVFCVWRLWRSRVALLAAFIVCMAIAVAAAYRNTELLPQSLAMVYWLAAAALWVEDRKSSLLAGLTAVMIAPGEWPALAVCVAVAGAAQLSQWGRSRVLQGVAALAGTVSVAGLVVLWHTEKPASRVFEYESAARSCERIAHEFRPKEWLVISPFQELPFTYGRGWHLDLSEFISTFTPDQVANPAFKFPYECPDVFFFVERRPLALGSLPGLRTAVWRYAPADSVDWPAYLYGSPIGRASLEYRAAALLDAYAKTHQNLFLFYQDDNLVVYHLIRAGGAS